MQIMIMGLYTVIAHLLHFLSKTNYHKIQALLFELEEGEIPPCDELAHSLE